MRVFLVVLFLLVIMGIFWNLGDRPFFGVEGRWAEAAREMSLRGSWFVPTINFEPHTTKPLLPFWLIKISGEFLGFNEFSVRLPGAILALLSVFLFYLLGLRLFDQNYALLSTILFASSLGLLQFARLAQSEIYQLFGIVLSLTIYSFFCTKKSFIGYLLFFLSVLFGALSKGLTTPAVISIFIFLDIIINKRFYHLNWKFFVALILSILIYFLPYYLTALELKTYIPFYLWFRENLKQAIDPYDNLRPFYIYFLYWPLWLAPYTLFLIFSIYYTIKNYKKLSPNEKVFLLSNILIFLLFTIAKARRGYYILPILPFSIILMTFYIKKLPEKFTLKSYKALSILIFFLTIISPFIIKYLNFPLDIKTIIILLFFSFVQLIGIIFYYKLSHPIYAIALIFLTVEVLFFGYFQAKFTYSTEKEAGLFVKSLVEKDPNLTLCTSASGDLPVANFYFYSNIKQGILKIENIQEALKKCQVLIFRKKVPETILNLRDDLNLSLMAFENVKESSKSYYILYYNSSTLKTPSF